MDVAQKLCNCLCHKAIDNGCTTEARAGQLGHAGNSNYFLCYAFPDPGCKWKRTCIFASIFSFIFMQEKIQAVSAKPEPDMFLS